MVMIDEDDGDDEVKEENNETRPGPTNMSSQGAKLPKEKRSWYRVVS